MATWFGQAQRAISASGILPGRVPPVDNPVNFLNFGAKGAAVPIPSLSTGRESQYSRRIQELEAELRAVKADNEKNVRTPHLSTGTRMTYCRFMPLVGGRGIALFALFPTHTRRGSFPLLEALSSQEIFADAESTQKLMITRFRERWEKLKESAKRKKEAKAASADGGSSAGGVKDRIIEEPEAEEALDGTVG